MVAHLLTRVQNRALRRTRQRLVRLHVPRRSGRNRRRQIVISCARFVWACLSRRRRCRAGTVFALDASLTCYRTPHERAQYAVPRSRACTLRIRCGNSCASTVLASTSRSQRMRKVWLLLGHCSVIARMSPLQSRLTPPPPPSPLTCHRSMSLTLQAEDRRTDERLRNLFENPVPPTPAGSGANVQWAMWGQGGGGAPGAFALSVLVTLCYIFFPHTFFWIFPPTGYLAPDEILIACWVCFQCHEWGGWEGRAHAAWRYAPRWVSFVVLINLIPLFSAGRSYSS